MNWLVIIILSIMTAFLFEMHHRYAKEDYGVWDEER